MLFRSTFMSVPDKIMFQPISLELAWGGASPQQLEGLGGMTEGTVSCWTTRGSYVKWQTETPGGDCTRLEREGLPWGAKRWDLTSLLFKEGVLRLELDPLRLGGRSVPPRSEPLFFSPFSGPACSPLGCGDTGSCWHRKQLDSGHKQFYSQI